MRTRRERHRTGTDWVLTAGCVILIPAWAAALAAPAANPSRDEALSGPPATATVAAPRPARIGPEQRALERVRDLLGASDEEWAALAPKVQQVLAMQRDANAGHGPGGPPGPKPRPGDSRGGSDAGPGPRDPGPGGRDAESGGPAERGPRGLNPPPPPDGDKPGPTDRPAPPPPSAVAEGSKRLLQLAADRQTPLAQVEAQMAEVRRLRAKARHDLAVAQEELRGLLAVRQEASLVGSGLLE